MADKSAWLAGKRASEEHWIPLSDLMTGLMMIFMLISVISMQQVEAKRNAIRQVAQQYTSSRQDLYQELRTTFAPDLKRWHARLDPDLTVRFDEPNVLFDTGQAVLKDNFKTILSEFFPRYVAIISAPKFRDTVKEIRIEGHTSSTWGGAASADDAYFRNMELSQSRTRSTLEYVLLLPQVSGEKAWLTRKLTANGLSSSQTLKIRMGRRTWRGRSGLSFVFGRMRSRGWMKFLRRDIEGKAFFLKKRNQKTFATTPTLSLSPCHPCTAPKAKVFASFFKKKRFLYSHFLCR